MHLLPQAENRLLKKKKKLVKAKLLWWGFLCLAYALHACSVPPLCVFLLGSGVVINATRGGGRLGNGDLGPRDCSELPCVPLVTALTTRSWWGCGCSSRCAKLFLGWREAGIMCCMWAVDSGWELGHSWLSPSPPACPEQPRAWLGNCSHCSSFVAQSRTGQNAWSGMIECGCCKQRWVPAPFFSDFCLDHPITHLKPPFFPPVIPNPCFPGIRSGALGQTPDPSGAALKV